MPRQTINRGEFEQQLDGNIDPITQLPPGLSPNHSKIPPTPSQFVVDTIRRVRESGVHAEIPSAEELAQREEVRTRFRRFSRRR